tara:strand:- start:1060 stop:1314 length:255 start_codon:yes stop_codon:yes gene_type:complete
MINEELETILNNTAEDILAFRKNPSQPNTGTLPRKMNVYIPCPVCARRMYEGLFQGHASCCSCRGVDAQGNKVFKGKEEVIGCE